MNKEQKVVDKKEALGEGYIISNYEDDVFLISFPGDLGLDEVVALRNKDEIEFIN